MAEALVTHKDWYKALSADEKKKVGQLLKDNVWTIQANAEKERGDNELKDFLLTSLKDTEKGIRYILRTL